MKVTYINDEASQDPAEMIGLCTELGLDSIELRTVKNKHVSKLDPEEKRDLKRRMDDAGIGCCCIGSAVYKSDLDGDNPKQLDKLRASIEAADYFGAQLIRAFSFWRTPEREARMPEVMDHLRRAGDVGRNGGKKLVLENGKKTMHATGVELAQAMAGLDEDVWGVCWDPGNSIFGRLDFDPLNNGYPAVKGRVWHVHIKDPQVYDGGRAYVEMGKGQLDIPGQLAVLKRDGYQGYISLETHWRPNREFKEVELDYPGGTSFSESGYEPTRRSLKYILARVAELA